MSDDIYPVEELTIDGSQKEHLTSEQFQKGASEWLGHVATQVSDDTVELTMNAVIRNGPFETQFHQFNGQNGKTNSATINTSTAIIKTNDVDNLNIFRNIADTVGGAWSEVEDEELSPAPLMSFDTNDGMTLYVPHPEENNTTSDDDDDTDNEDTDNED